MKWLHDETAGFLIIDESECGLWYGMVWSRAPNIRIAFKKDEYGAYFSFFANKSGVQIPVWDERPEANGDGWYCCQYIMEAIDSAMELESVCRTVGISIDDPSEARVLTAISARTFIVPRDGSSIVCRREKHVLPRRRKVTQKRLDGGEDITV